MNGNLLVYFLYLEDNGVYVLFNELIDIALFSYVGMLFLCG